jgi:hypothetical protein
LGTPSSGQSEFLLRYNPLSMGRTIKWKKCQINNISAHIIFDMIKFQFIGLWNEFLFPAIVIYTLMQEQMISGLTSGALKG